jgi:hypothetical protein
MQFKLAEEVDVFLRLADQFELSNCGEFLCKIRIRPNSLSLYNVRQDIMYQFYALDCEKKRHSGRPELDYGTFIQSMSLDTKYRIWREEHLLKLWRGRMHGGGFSSLLLAALLDPRRLVIRGLRKLDERRIKNYTDRSIKAQI